MVARETAGRLSTRILAGIVIFLMGGVFSLAGEQTVSDLTGQWEGKYKGFDKGTVTVSIAQTGMTASMTGSFIPKGETEVLQMEGSYTLDGDKPRKMTGTASVTIEDPPHTEHLELWGKCNKKGKRLKWKLQIIGESEKLKVRLKKLM
jgi:hypothetical protein